MAKKKKAGRKRVSGQKLKKKNSSASEASVVAQGDKAGAKSQAASAKDSGVKSPVKDKPKSRQSQKNAKSNKASDKVAASKGLVDRLTSFLKDVRVEFDRITWATRKETVATTVVVLAITFFFAAYLGLVDMVLSKLISLLLY